MENVIATVTTLREGETGVVSSIGGRESLTSRLAAMGIVPGTAIKMLRNGAGPVIVLASDTRLALGKLEASRVFVSKAAPRPRRRAYSSPLPASRTWENRLSSTY